MDLSQVAIGFVSGGVCIGGAILLQRSLRTREAIPEPMNIEPVHVPVAPPTVVSEDQAEVIRLRALEEGKERGRAEARVALEKEQQLATDLAATKAFHKGYTQGRKEAQESYRIDIVPFFRKRKVGFAGFKKFHYDYGYNYQLFVNDMPCLEPTERVIKTETESDIDPEQLKNNVQGLVESVVSAAKDGLVGNIKVGKAIEKKEPE
jgi:hypothetical protein